MKLQMTMCHSQLMIMLLAPTRLHSAVYSYKSTSPDMSHEHQTGRMMVEAEFEIKDISKFIELWEYAQDMSDQPDWYDGIKAGIDNIV